MKSSSVSRTIPINGKQHYPWQADIKMAKWLMRASRPRGPMINNFWPREVNVPEQPAGLYTPSSAASLASVIFSGKSS
jgi:hypothetical protein